MSLTTSAHPTPHATRNWPHAAWNLLRTTFQEWNADKAPKLGAALAYYTVFSLAPLLVISLAIAAWVFGEEFARRALQTQLQGLLGEEGASAVQSLLTAAQQPATGTWAAILGVITLFLGATGVFGELQDSLNTIWKVNPKETSGLWDLIRQRFLSFTMVLGVGFLLLVSLVITAFLSGMIGVVSEWTGGTATMIQTANVVVSLITVTILFALIFKVLPDTPVAWRDVWLGAIFTAVLFTLGKQLLGLYLGRASVASAYGAAGSIVLVLLRAYYSAQILFFGAEFTHAFARLHGSKSEEKNA
jgi:membrane protein